MYASGWSSVVYGPHENHRVTAGSEASSSSRGASAARRVAQRQRRAGDDERIGLVREHGAPMVYTRRMLACLYDVHGNLPALEAVLADAGRAGRDAATCSAATTRCSAAGRPRRWSGCASSSNALLDPRQRRALDRRARRAAPDNPVVQGAIARRARALGAELVAAMARARRADPRTAAR